MNQYQSIIVYRNPAEAHLWESGLMFPIMVAMVISCIAAIVVGRVVSKTSFKAKSAEITFTVLFVTFCAVIYKMV